MGLFKTLKRKTITFQNLFSKNLELKKKNIIITGANSGIALALLKTLNIHNNILAFVNRDKIIKYMKTKGIETRNGFYSPNRLLLYRGCDTSNLKYSEKLSKNIICLPFFTSLKEREMEYIAKTLLDLKR